MWKIKISENAEEFINSLPKEERVKCYWIFKLAREKGVNLKPHSKYLQDGIWELKFKNVRLLYFLVKDTFIITNAFIKKTQKSPKRAIQKALEVKKDFLSGGVNL